jgi:DNA-binding NarL/FixJ family response regulator
MKTPGQRIRTFIVEDSPIILENLVATLEELSPVQVIGSAGDEASAVQWLLHGAQSCELVIIDVYLRSGSGLGVLRSTAHAGLTGKCVVLTNYATPGMRAKCTLLGAHRVFDKSGELDELITYCTQLANPVPAVTEPEHGADSATWPSGVLPPQAH